MVDPDAAMNVDQRKPPLIPENPVPLFDFGMLGSSTLLHHGSSNFQFGSSHQVLFSSSLSLIVLRLSCDIYAFWRSQFLPVARAFNFDSYFLGFRRQKPPQFVELRTLNTTCG